MAFEIAAGQLRTLSGGSNRALRGSFSTGAPNLVLASVQYDARGRPDLILRSGDDNSYFGSYPYTESPLPESESESEPQGYYSELPLTLADIAPHLRFVGIDDVEIPAQVQAIQLAAAKSGAYFAFQVPYPSDSELAGKPFRLLQTAGIRSVVGANLGGGTELGRYPAIADFIIDIACVSGCFAEWGLDVRFNSKPTDAAIADVLAQLSAQGLTTRTRRPHISNEYSNSAIRFKPYVYMAAR